MCFCVFFNVFVYHISCEHYNDQLVVLLEKQQNNIATTFEVRHKAAAQKEMFPSKTEVISVDGVCHRRTPFKLKA